MFGLVISFLTSLFLLFSVSESTCNYAVLDFLPIAADECNTCSGDDCGNVGSAEVVCDDSDEASIIQYEGSSCSGTVYNTTYPGDYLCGETGSCDTLDVTIASYSDADCEGSADSKFNFALAEDAEFCISFASILYAGVSLNESGIIFDLYLDSDCSGTKVGTSIFGDGSCDNGTSAEFSGGSSINNYYTFMTIFAVTISAVGIIF